jgi:uncharacterized protein (TIGR01777 family)
MRLGITGATGLIGGCVAALARRRGHEVIGFTRRPEGRGAGWRRFTTAEAPDVSGCDAILNLAGETVIGLWTPAKVRAIKESRVLGTRRIVEAIRSASPAPRVLVNSSGIGIYGNAGDQVTDEAAAHGTGYLAEVCEEWEAEALRAREAGARVALLRTGMVLSREGGALGAMLPIFRLGLGGKLGNGRQWVSWIHIEDEVELALATLLKEAYDGPVNATAPNPVRNAEFTKALASRLHRPAFFAAPAFALRAVAGGFSAELLESRRIVPAAAAKAGFAFRFPDIGEALDDLLKQPA